jgi:hypothetical protein
MQTGQLAWNARLENIRSSDHGHQSDRIQSHTKEPLIKSRKANALQGCDKNGRLLCCAPWHLEDKAPAQQVIQGNPNGSFMDKGKTADSRLSEIIYRSFLIHIASIAVFEYPFFCRRFCVV